MIEIKLNKTYKNQKVLKNISIQIKENTMIALLGPNGSGKTTLIKCLLGLVIPDKDSKLYYKGEEIDFNLSRYLRIGYIPQVPIFPQNLMVKDLLEYLISFEEKYPEYFDALLKELNILDFYTKKVYELSGGMKQKLNILQCLMNKRDLYILDEPTSSLDPYYSYYLKNKLKELKSNSTILFTTHILNEVEELSDEMIILIDGEVKIQKDPKKFILNQNAKNLEEALSLIKEYIKI